MNDKCLMVRAGTSAQAGRADTWPASSEQHRRWFSVGQWLAILLAVLLAGQLFVAPALAQGAAAAAPTPDEAPKVSSPSDSPAPSSAAPESASEEPAPAAITRMDMLLASLTIFVLAIFVGFEIITKVPPTLHTPLMSGSNAISGITIVGALIVAGTGLGFAPFLGFTAVILATVNVVGGFLVTHRMLAMFKKR